MINAKEFEDLLKEAECETLDFKRNIYDFDSDKEGETAKFIKDVISLSNTPRKKNSYIIFGVSVLSNGKKEEIGLMNLVDDAMLQQKIKDKTYPIPKFNFYPLLYDKKVFGIIEIAPHPYDTPIEPTKRMQGLELNKVYFRRGSSNSEASVSEIVQIGHWLKELKSELAQPSINKNMLLKNILKCRKLSELMPDIIDYANTNNDNILLKLCHCELNKYSDSGIKELVDLNINVEFRVTEIFTSADPIEANGADTATLKKYFKEDEHIHLIKFLFNYPLHYLEDCHEKLQGNNTYVTLTMDAGKFLNDAKWNGRDVYAYGFKSTFETLLMNIRSFFISYISK